MKIIVFTCNSTHPEHRVRVIEEHIRTARAFMSSLSSDFWLISDERPCSYWEESIRKLQEPCDDLLVAEIDSKSIRGWMPRQCHEWVANAQEHESPQVDAQNQTSG